MINIGINGFGRIGKCLFLQLISNINFKICCINSIDIKITDIEDYLTYDSTHKINKKWTIKIISDSEFIINHHKIKLFSDRNAINLNWKNYGCEYLIDATGSYLTTQKCLDHNVNYVIMSAPAKDNTPTFIYGVNDDKYLGEKIVSGSSCTTNSISPILKLLNINYKIKDCIFTTIHSSTASQFVVDVANSKSRITRSSYNNIIPYTTGALSSIISVLPELKNKINGTSIRVPVTNCSLLDINVLLETNVSLKQIIEDIKLNNLYKILYNVNNKNLVSSDFITTSTPTILDINASIDMGNGKLKLMVWYDNEWSYATQLIRLVESMNKYNKSIKEKYYIENIPIQNKGVVCRFDFNVPIKNEIITDDFRIISAIPTIKTILQANPKYIILTS